MDIGNKESSTECAAELYTSASGSRSSRWVSDNSLNSSYLNLSIFSWCFRFWLPVVQFMVCHDEHSGKAQEILDFDKLLDFVSQLNVYSPCRVASQTVSSGPPLPGSHMCPQFPNIASTQGKSNSFLPTGQTFRDSSASLPTSQSNVGGAWNDPPFLAKTYKVRVG